MCGITGFLDLKRSVTQTDLQNASAVLAHRGGNGNGILFEDTANYTMGLANERLATIDVAEHGLQPFTSSCGNYTITFNGTIYNYIELREELIKYGITFLTLTDTEVLLECYKKWGVKLFEKIDGAFAFVILDRKLKQFFVARDSVGVKPLYFYKDNQFFAFSSEIRGLLTYPGISKKINTKALQNYFRHGYFFGSDTIFEGIHSFKKQQFMVIDLNSGNSYEKPFATQIRSTPVATTEKEILQDVEELLTDSILKRSIASVPVGVLLSGGYDSATTAAILQKNQTKRIRTFTLGFEERKFNEVPQARKIAEHLKTNHQEFQMDKKAATDMLELLPEIFDEPVGDSGAIPLAFLANQINSEVKVVLVAEGGDELFGGYKNYKKAMQLKSLTQKTFTFLKPVLSTVFSKRARKINELFNADSLLETYLSLNTLFSDEELIRLIGEEPVKINIKKKDGLKAMLDHDLENYLPNNLLLKTDRTFMHFGIDNRDAILKTDLIDYLKQLDEKWLIKDGKIKYILKKIAHEYLPERLMNRPKKGLNIPIANWLKTCYKPYVEMYLSPAMLNKHQLFNEIEVRKIKNNFYQHSTTTNAKKVWLLLQFQMWYSRWMD